MRYNILYLGRVIMSFSDYNQAFDFAMQKFSARLLATVVDIQETHHA